MTESQKNRRLFLVLLIFGSAVGGALVASGLTALFAHDEAEHHQHDVVEASDFHIWLHSQLDLTAEQERELEPIEASYDGKRAAIAGSLEAASRELAEAVADEDSPRAAIDRALADVQRLQGELQSLTLDHFYEMKTTLDAEQTREVRKWIHDSIVNKHAH